MQIGLFFGTFNPMHTGHLIIAQYMLDYTKLDEVWFIVSPQNPLKDKNGLLDPERRLEMVELAIQDEPNFRASNVEFDLPMPSFTINTLRYLSGKSPDHHYGIIMGSDNMLSFDKWKDHEDILENYHIYVYPRPNVEKDKLINHPNVTMHDVPLLYISSSFIRNALKKKTSVKNLLPDRVHQFILKHDLFA